MPETAAPGNAPFALELLPFQAALRDFLRRTEAEVWNWFARDPQGAGHLEALKFDLLKSTYRIDRASQPQLYESAEGVAQQLGVDAPITLYQAQNPAGLNASLVYLPGEVHLVLHGPIAAQLTELELRGLWGHELTHFVLQDRWDHELWTTHRLLAALSQDRHVHSAHLASLRLLLLYDEILCDRGALLVTRDLHAVVSMLLKVHTGVMEVSAESFLKQADEVFARGTIATQELDHPETFLRARAIQLWSEQGSTSNRAIAAMIEGQPALDALDLLGQVEVASATRRLFDQLFARPWFRTNLTLAHARLFFPDYAPPSHATDDAKWIESIRIEPTSLGDYFAFVLLDFVAADRELDEPALALALTLAEQIGVKTRFVELARQELKLRKNQLEKVDLNKDPLLAAAEATPRTESNDSEGPVNA